VIKYFLTVGFLSLCASNTTMAQHGGTDQEQRACAGSVRRYCRVTLDQGTSLYWPGFNNTGKGSPRPAGRFSSASARVIVIEHLLTPP